MRSDHRREVLPLRRRRRVDAVDVEVAQPAVADLEVEGALTQAGRKELRSPGAAEGQSPRTDRKARVPDEPPAAVELLQPIAGILEVCGELDDVPAGRRATDRGHARGDEIVC